MTTSTRSVAGVVAMLALTGAAVCPLVRFHVGPPRFDVAALLAIAAGAGLLRARGPGRRTPRIVVAVVVVACTAGGWMLADRPSEATAERIDRILSSDGRIGRLTVVDVHDESVDQRRNGDRRYTTDVTLAWPDDGPTLRTTVRTGYRLEPGGVVSALYAPGTPAAGVVVDDGGGLRPWLGGRASTGYVLLFVVWVVGAAGVVGIVSRRYPGPPEPSVWPVVCAVPASLGGAAALALTLADPRGAVGLASVVVVVAAPLATWCTARRNGRR